MNMSFTLPADAHPVMRQGLAYWQAAAPGPNLLPGHQHVDPLHIPELLPHAWLLEVHPPGEGMSIPRFRFRLLGSHINLAFDKPQTGTWLHDLEPGFGTVTASSRSFVDAATNAQVSHRRGTPRFRRNADAAELERLILPLAADGRHVDMLLGFTVYYDGIGSVLRSNL